MFAKETALGGSFPERSERPKDVMLPVTNKRDVVVTRKICAPDVVIDIKPS